MSVMDDLRAGTRAQHEALHGVVDLRQMTQDRGFYASMLQRYLNAVAPSESEVRSYLSHVDLDDKPSPDWNRRLRKAEWLQSDLKALGHEPVSSPVGLSQPNPTNSQAETLGHLLGTAYVMEGMTLGADRMVGTISERLSVTVDGGARFFTGYGQDNGTMWKQFRAWGDTLEVNADVAVETAQRIFDRFADCLSGRTQPGENA